MAIVVEDGSMPAGANAYASVATVDAWATERGRNAAWLALSTAAKEAAIVQATDYLNGLRWFGKKVAQRVMAWPRVGVLDIDGWPYGSDEVPDVVVYVCCYLAGEIAAGDDLLASQDRAMASVAVGSIRVEYEKGSSAAKYYPAVSAMLRGLVMSRSTIVIGRG